MNPLKQQIARLARAAKRYLTADLQHQLENSMNKLNRTAQENTASIQSLAVRLDDNSDGIAHNSDRKSAQYGSTLHAAQILELNTQIERLLPLWQACDSILACPITLSACRTLFPGKTILHDTNTAELLGHLTGTKVKSIGIASPWLFRDILKLPHGLHTIMQSCSSHLLFIIDTEYFPDQSSLRQAMHRVGFYNVSIAATADTEDFISTACLPTGEFLLAGSEPALPHPSRRWIVQKAARAPDITAPEQQWNNVAPKPFLHSNRGITAEQNGFALAISAASGYEPDNASRISCTMSWSDGSPSDHTSLIGSYHGPGDTGMYVGMLQVAQENNAIVSLWVNHGTWQRLEATTIAAERITSIDGVSNLSIWLEITPTQVKIGTNDIVLIDVKDVSIKRSPYVGVRASGNTIAASNIKCTVNSPCP